MGNLHQLIALFSAAERRQIARLLALVLAMAAAEVIGVASIMPFMLIAANPDIVQSNAQLRWVYETLAFQSVNRFILFSGAVFLLLVIGSNALAAVTTWRTLRFTCMQAHSLSTRLLVKYLRQPYEFFLDHHSAELTKNVLGEVGRFISGVLLPAMQVLVKGTVAVCILALLLALDPLLAVVVALVLGGAYALTYSLLRRRLAHIGRDATAALAEKYRLTAEAFGGIKDIRVLDREETFIARYAAASRRAAEHESLNQTFAMLPRYVLESIAFGGILVIMLYIISVKRDLGSAIPLLSLYALAGYKLMPALQSIFVNLTALRYNISALHTIHADLVGLPDASGAPAAAGAPLAPTRTIELRDIGYRYPGAARATLERLNLVVEARTTVGFVGTTGAGKSTIVDLLLGLLAPNAGAILVDGCALMRADLPRWRRAVGYVPQQIYLADASIAANIAFGAAAGEIDMDRVRRAARTARLADFVERELPDGYQTPVGERGVKLSGGQRQRIGIARALYHDPQVLILDEATSALDNLTEGAVMEAIAGLAHQMTILIVAHRLSTVRECDVIYLLENGGIAAHGSYAELEAANERFRAMTEAA